MLRAPLRSLPRTLPVRSVQPQLRHATTSTAQRRFAVYQSQTTNPVLYASLGLAALFGWTAAILTVGGKSGKRAQREKDHKKAASTEATQSLAPAVAPAAAEPSPASGASAADPASQQAAFNPETGEINWDCPCLGGMADGPCGEDFKAAFSCFVYSEAEPKGIDCVEKFRGMQECFRKHPDIYGDESEDLAAEDEDEGFDLISRAEAALALPDEHFLEEVAKEAPTKKPAEAAANLE
ncbi:Oxidoreductase [Rhodotorula kratochvilovae]